MAVVQFTVYEGIASVFFMSRIPLKVSRYFLKIEAGQHSYDAIYWEYLLSENSYANWANPKQL